MNMMSIKQRDTSSKEFANESHIARKQRAEQKVFKKKNQKDMIHQLTDNDEDEEDLQKYIRFIK